jgi:hypothetical protein
MAAGRADIGQEFARIPFVQIAHGGGQHDDVTGGLVITQDEFTHHSQSRVSARSFLSQPIVTVLANCVL